ncbi:MAG: ABC transporter ATP-binding protein, partial [Caldilineaceae bacterium]
MYRNLRRLFKFYKGFRGRVIGSQLLLAAAVLTNLVLVSLNGRIVDEGVNKGDVDAAVQIAIWMFLLSLVYTVFVVGNAWIAVQFSEGTGHYLRVRAFDRIQNLSFGNIDRFRTGDLLVRLTTDINNVRFAVLYGFMLLLQAPITIVLTIFVALAIAPSMMPLMLASMAVIGVALIFLVRGLTQMYRARQEKYEKTNNVLQEALSGVRVVKAFVREEYETQRFEATAGELKDAALKAAYRIAAFVPTLMGLVYISVAVVIFAGGRSVLNEAGMTMGQVVVFSNLLVTAIAPIAMLAFILPYFEQGEASLERIFEVLDETPEVQDRPDAKAADPAAAKGRIVFENVSFGYRDAEGKSETLALEGVNLTIEAGETVGFLGATGSGKSSLISLIPRYYDVVEGRVTIDGVDVREMTQASLRQIVGVALQEAVLFSGTVRGNILFGRPDVDDGEMIAASQAADADGFVSAIPEGYDAPVTRRGTNFSGGQRQRLAIARALANQPRVLILDDSTSALDLATEARVQDAVSELMGATTKLYVA